jgi:hydrogenase expression/formation protein HypC
MCLAMPSKVVDVLDDDMAVIELGGVKKTISLGLVENVSPGDYVIVHVGYALSKIDEDEALKTIALFDEMTNNGNIAP